MRKLFSLVLILSIFAAITISAMPSIKPSENLISNTFKGNEGYQVTDKYGNDITQAFIAYCEEMEASGQYDEIKLYLAKRNATISSPAITKKLSSTNGNTQYSVSKDYTTYWMKENGSSTGDNFWVDDYSYTLVGNYEVNSNNEIVYANAQLVTYKGLRDQIGWAVIGRIGSLITTTTVNLEAFTSPILGATISGSKTSVHFYVTYTIYASEWVVHGTQTVVYPISIISDLLHLFNR